MNNYIIIGILLLCMIPAVRGTITHLRGDGACCGGLKERAHTKKIKGKELYKYVITIDGMYCVNCKNRIQNGLNELDGVTAKVSYEKKQAVVQVYQAIPELEIRNCIEKIGYKTR